MKTAERRVKVWDLPLRLFHWTLVVAIAVAFLSSEEDSALNNWHVLAGWVAAVLLVFRLVWGLIGGEHSRFVGFIRPSRITHHIAGLARGQSEPSLGHNPLGALAVVILLALTGVTVWTGAFGGEAAEEFHEIIAWVLLGMVALHVSAVVVMSIFERENLVRAMITGDKSAVRHPQAVDARPPGAVALVVASVVIVAIAYAITRYDPQAFTLRSAETFEHRADGGEPSGAAEHVEDDD